MVLVVMSANYHKALCFCRSMRVADFYKTYIEITLNEMKSDWINIHVSNTKIDKPEKTLYYSHKLLGEDLTTGNVHKLSVPKSGIPLLFFDLKSKDSMVCVAHSHSVKTVELLPACWATLSKVGFRIDQQRCSVFFMI